MARLGTEEGKDWGRWRKEKQTPRDENRTQSQIRQAGLSVDLGTRDVVEDLTHSFQVSSQPTASSPDQRDCVENYP